MEPMRIAGRGGTEKLMRQRGSWVILALLISAFGPYIPKAQGLRVEHIVIYGLASAFVLSWMRVRSRSGDSHARTIAVLMMFTMLWTGLVTVSAGRAFDAKVVAEIENYLQPVALLIILTFVLSRNRVDAKRLLDLAAVTICVLLTLNSLVALATVFFDTWPLVQYFVGDVSGYEGWSVWGNAASGGRYSGIFNQPFECGLAHSLGLLSWVYLSLFLRHHPVVRALLFAGVLTGGLLSLSKVFLLGGIPLATFYWIWEGRQGVGAFRGLIGVVLVLGAFFAWIAPNWVAFDSLRSFSDSETVEYSGGALSYYTAGRFGPEETGVQAAFARTWQQAPVQGFGFAAGEGWGDNAYLGVFYQGGFVALLLYLIILGTIASAMKKGLKKDVPEGKLVGLLLVLIVGAGLGAPILTINRASILLWVLLVLSMSLCTEKMRETGRPQLVQSAGPPAPAASTLLAVSVISGSTTGRWQRKRSPR
ncbi:MAG: hypothetical protein ACYDGS_04775 [Thermoleophilia bacterium]